MCVFEKLYQGDQGYVVRCAQCGHYQIAFGTFCMVLEEENFQIIRRLVSDASAKIGLEHCDAKSVSIGTPHNGVILLLTPAELVKLQLMIEGADTEAKTLTLLHLFQQPAR